MARFAVRLKNMLTIGIAGMTMLVAAGLLVLSCAASQPEPRTSIDVPPDHCAMLHLKRPLAPGEPDADDDCVPDSLDRCVNEPEDHDRFDDEDGCPDPDNDRDGVHDASDRCPLEPGVASNEGCPI